MGNWGLRASEESSSVNDDRIDGGGDLGGDYVHLIFSDQSVTLDRVEDEALEGVHSGLDGGEVEKSDSSVGADHR